MDADGTSCYPVKFSLLDVHTLYFTLIEYPSLPDTECPRARCSRIVTEVNPRTLNVSEVHSFNIYLLDHS